MEIQTVEQDSPLSGSEYNTEHGIYNVKQIKSYARRLAVCQFVKCLQTSGDGHHSCCEMKYPKQRDLYRHVNCVHNAEISAAMNDIITNGSQSAKWKILRKKDQHTSGPRTVEPMLPHTFTEQDKYPWLPQIGEDSVNTEGGRILLFYKYCSIEDTQHVKEWQETLCQRLKLTGKIRVSREGLNGTVAGTMTATETYMMSVINHPLFSDMTKEDFKTSEGNIDAFPDGLRVGIYEEAVPMGIKPDDVSYRNAGVHLTPGEFHQAMVKISSEENQSEAVVIDCRNYYESKIGRFDGAVAPDIRKFSYWPEYVDSNPELFRNKDVYMYCTGGIRCERGSAYLKAKGLCKEVFQLKGGIHKYAEQFPTGFYKGKLFVFDNRFAIPVNDVMLSDCIYCNQPWDKYEPCSSKHCHQLVLSCSECRNKQLTACCTTCQQNNELQRTQEECDCTRRRDRVVVEPSDINLPNNER